MAPRTDRLPISIFYSYAHEDEEFRQKLEKHLSILKRQGGIEGWHDRKISAGEEWKKELEQHLDSAPIILLLISADFINSDFCYAKEMERALERHRAGEARVIPIIIRPVDWTGAPFGELQALPRDAKPVTSWENQDEAWTNVAKGIRNAVEEMQERKVQLDLPLKPVLQTSSDPTSTLLAILQTCPDPLPFEVVAATFACLPQALEQRLAPLVEKGIVQIEDALCRVVSPSSSPELPNIQDLLPKVLEELLAFIEVHRRDKEARDQLVNAVDLAKKCLDTHPRRISNVFRILDKLLKRRGDKRLILDVANLSIEAAQRPASLRNEDVIKGEAHALICGRSWVLQRVDRLHEAQAAAERSLTLGQDIGWDRNTAYCKKCMGRLFRLQAEQQQGAQRVALLEKSIESLNDAIERFGKMSDFGSTHPEVGDCYSLLGRTYLVAGRLREADTAVKKAYQLIYDEGSKDYLDMVILSGDVQVAHRNRQTAASLYDQALSLKDHDDPEISELRARAYIARGRNREAMNNPQGARSDYEKAAEIYQELGEASASAEARWEALRVDGKVSREVARMLEGERATVRIAALALHERRSRMRSSTAVAQRGAASKSYWQQLIREAHTQAAAEEREW